MLIIPQDPSDNDTEDGGKTITQAFSFRRVGMVVGGFEEEMVGGLSGLWEPPRGAQHLG